MMVVATMMNGTTSAQDDTPEWVQPPADEASWTHGELDDEASARWTLGSFPELDPAWSGEGEPWYLDASSCDQVCADLSPTGEGATCLQSELDALDGFDDDVLLAISLQAGLRNCNEFIGFNCLGPNACVEWGAPYVHNSDVLDGGACGTMQSGTPVAPCSQVPVDMNHRRLCPCAPLTTQLCVGNSDPARDIDCAAEGMVLFAEGSVGDSVALCCVPVGNQVDCNPDTAVCVESDLFLIQQGADFESLTPGCQCCFMSIQDDLSADPFVLCLEPLFPQVDFCADPGNAQSNPDAVPGHCLHLCENYNALWEEVEAAGCFNDQHEDYICVTEGVFAPGEMQPWGETCCSWCGDSDGDGNPDYQGCCEGMRADGEMGCEDTRCEWLCNGINCFEHGEDQATCEGIGGTWETLGTSCEEQIAGQGMYQMMYERSGMGVDLAAIFWLADYGDVCCTGYEPAGPGSCDDDIDNYVSVSIVCFAL